MAQKQAKTIKNLKKTAKKNFNSFLFMCFYWEEKISLIKKACFMLIFLNLKSKARHLFLGVASSLSGGTANCPDFQIVPISSLVPIYQNHSSK
jgi:hypothetical protein